MKLLEEAYLTIKAYAKLKCTSDTKALKMLDELINLKINDKEEIENRIWEIQNKIVSKWTTNEYFEDYY